MTTFWYWQGQIVRRTTVSNWNISRWPSGVGVRSVASLGLNISGEKFEAAASGNGPVDAAIKALKKIIDRHMTLKEFTIQAISKGSDDMGKVHMQVEYDNHI